MPTGFTPRAAVGVARFGVIAVGVAIAGAVLAGGVPTEIETIVVTGQRPLEDAPSSSTEGYVTAEQLAERPISRAGELLEFVPGLMVTQHSGEGKANQYFLRGFNLDHGTDFYSEVDGLPVNMRTHGHGQGYADINFIIPELIGSLEYRKGPYYADIGDFGAAGSASLRYVDELPHNIARITQGEYGYTSALLAGSPKLGEGRLLLGVQATRYAGPYGVSEQERKYSGVARYNQGTEREGFTASLMGYGIDYNAPDQIPLRAVTGRNPDGSPVSTSLRIGRLGVIDPSDGGNVGRYSANLEWRGQADGGSRSWRAQAYALKYRLQLFSDFSYFFADPSDADGQPDDQFNQFDDRRVYGLNARRVWKMPASIPVDVEAGVQARYDDISPVALRLTQDRHLHPVGSITDGIVRQDRAKEGSAGVYLSSTQQWTPWFRSQLGLRGDGYHFDVNSRLDENSGKDKDGIVSPKLALIFGPYLSTLIYANYGEGFHSNDARGVTNRIDPTSGEALDKVDALVKARGGELGVTSAVLPNVKIAASLFALNFDSELVYVGDAGGNEAGGSSKRRGVELSVYYAPLSWLIFDADYAYNHARLDSPDGNRIPNSIESIFGLGVTVPETLGWSAGLRLRRLGPGPLIEDNSARSQSTTVVNAQGGYRWMQRYSLTTQVLNVFDSHDNDITYFYESRLPGEPAEGIADYHFHSIAPRELRVTLGAAF